MSALGDGSPITQPYASKTAGHTYAAPGTYTVRVEATNGLGTRATGETQITVPSLYGVTLTAPTAEHLAQAGHSVDFVVHVTNTGLAADTFAFSGTDCNCWTWNLPGPVTLAAGAGQDVTVTAHVPTNAAPGQSDTLVLKAASFNASATASLKVTVDHGSGLDVIMGTPPPPANYGMAVEHVLTVKNTGDAADTFAFTAEGYAWTTEVPAEQVLAAGESKDVVVKVHVPANATSRMDTALVTVKSTTDAAKATPVQVMTTAWNRIFMPSVHW